MSFRCVDKCKRFHPTRSALSRHQLSCSHHAAWRSAIHAATEPVELDDIYAHKSKRHKARHDPGPSIPRPSASSTAPDVASHADDGLNDLAFDSALPDDPMQADPAPAAEDSERPSVRQRTQHRVPRKFRDLVPAPLRPVLPLITSVVLLVAQPFTTAANAFGLFRTFPGGRPAHDPDQAAFLEDLLKAQAAPPTAPVTEPSYGPYPSRSTALFNDWFWNHGNEKSLASRDALLELLRTPGFDAQHVGTTDFNTLDDLLAGDLGHFGDGWTARSVSVDIPCGKGRQAVPVVIPGLQTRSLLNTFVHDLTTNPAVKTFHWEPEILMHQRSTAQPSTQVHGEVWTSRRFRRMHKEVQRLRKPGDDLPHCVLALMPGSDATHLAQFGTASAWPGYFDYGNRSKYVRAKREAKTMQHCVSFPKLPDDINDTLRRLGVTQPSVKREILTHLRRELNHAAWTSLLDDDFRRAYQHGVVIACADGITRRIFPRFFCYIADYPEKMLIATLKDNGGCPCPRCLVKKEEIHLVGTPEDLQGRRANVRQHDGLWTRTINAARSLINKGITVFKSKRVTKLLKPKSWVPTQNAFECLKAIHPSFSVFELFTPDLLHEIELGVWKNLLIHLLRILQAADPGLLDVFNERFRQMPVFGRTTIRRFSNNVSELKQLAAHNYEDILQCIIVAIDGLLEAPHDEIVHDVLFSMAEWHALAKLRMHTEGTLKALEEETVTLTTLLRKFSDITCSAFKASELPRERAARLRRAAKAGASNGAATAEDSNTADNTPAAKEKHFNMNTYKMHALPDYPDAIREYGTMDSYTTMLTESAHPELKARYHRTNKRRAMAQVGRIERIQANTRDVIIKNERPKPIAVGIDEESLPLTRLNDHHGVSAREKESINITDFAQKNFNATRAAEFPNKLRDHLLTRLLKKDYDGDETTYSTEERLRLIIDKNRMYEHKTMQINYTTYDVRRGQDIIHVGTDRCDVMMLSCEDGPDAHPFWYARVLGIYHVNACLAGQDKDTQIYFLHVRWFGRDDVDDGRRRLTRVGWDEENEYGFIDPAYVLRACHIAPAFAHGTAPIRAALRRAEEEDYNYYYVLRWSDRDLLMRFRGDGIGHQVLLSKPYKEAPAPAAPAGSEPEVSEEGTRGGAGGPERGSEDSYEIDPDLEARQEAGDSENELDGEGEGDEEEDEWDDEEDEDAMGMEDDAADGDYYG